MTEDQAKRLARALENMAANLRPLPPQGGGFNISVVGGGPGSRTTGFSQTLTATGDGQTLIGFQNTLSDVHVSQLWEQTTSELRQAAQAVRENKAPKSWLENLVSRVANMGAKVIESDLVATTVGLIHECFP